MATVQKKPAKKKPAESLARKAYNLSILPYMGKMAKEVSKLTIYPYASAAVKRKVKTGSFSKKKTTAKKK